MLKSGILSLLLRLLTSASRFVLLVVLARTLDVADVGRFGLLLVTVQLGCYLAGLDFALFSIREIATGDSSTWPRVVRDQLFVHLAAYGVVLPACVLVFVADLLPWSLAGWFYLLFLPEHLCHELGRWLMAMSRPVAANVVLFLRSGLWVYAVVALLWLEPGTRGLGTVLVGWLAGAAAAILYGVWVLRDLDWRSALVAPLGRAWVRRGLAVALPFLVSSLSLRGIATVDRYVLKAFAGEGAVGVYALFFGIANLLVVATESGVIAILTPKLCAAEHGGTATERRALYRKLTRATLATTILGGLVLAAAIGGVLRIVERPVYAASLGIFWVLLGAAVVMAVTYIPHSTLYARGQDRAIIVSAVAGLVVAVVANLLFVPRWGGLGTAYATLAAAATIFVGKSAFVLRPHARPA